MKDSGLHSQSIKYYLRRRDKMGNDNQGSDFIIGLSVDSDKVLKSLEAAIKKATILEAQVKQAEASLAGIANIKTGPSGNTTANVQATKRAAKELKDERDALSALINDIPRATARSKGARAAGTVQATGGVTGQIEIKSHQLTAISNHLGQIKQILNTLQLKMGMFAPGTGAVNDKTLRILGATSEIQTMRAIVKGVDANKKAGMQHVSAAGNVPANIGYRFTEDPEQQAENLAIAAAGGKVRASRAREKFARLKKLQETGSGYGPNGEILYGPAEHYVSPQRQVNFELKNEEQKRNSIWRATNAAHIEDAQRRQQKERDAQAQIFLDRKRDQDEMSRRRAEIYSAEQQAIIEDRARTKARANKTPLQLMTNQQKEQTRVRLEEAVQARRSASSYLTEPMRDASKERAARYAEHEKAMRMNAAFDTNKGVVKEAPIENVFRRALLFGAVSAAIFKSVQAGQAFIQTMITMDKQMADLHKTLGGTKEDFEKLMNSAIEIARTYKGSTQDVLDAMEIFSAQFKAPSDLEALSKSAILFSNISGQGLKASAETLTATINQYELAASQALTVTDSWANVAANSAVTIDDLGKAFGAAGNAAKTAGLSINELNAMVGVVATSTGKSGPEIGNAFKRMFERSTSDENAGTLYEKFGISVKDQAGNFRPFMQVLEDVDKKWNKLGATEKKQIAVAFAGARQYDAFIALMNNFASVTDLVTVSQNSLGAAQRQNERIGDTFTKKIQLLGNEYDNLARAAGERALPAMGSLVTMMTSLLRLFNDSSDAVKTFGLALASITALNLGGSALFKFLAMNNGKIRKGAGGIAEAIGAQSIGEGGSVSLLRGLGRGTAKMVGYGGELSGLAALGVGFATAAAALTTLILVIKGVVAIYNDLRDTTKELVQAQQDVLSKARQEKMDILKTTRSINDLIEERKTIQNDKTLLPEEKTRRIAGVNETLSGILRDVSIKNPNMLSKEGIVFDSFGRAVNATDAALGRLVSSLDKASREIEKNAQKETTKTAEQAVREIYSVAGGEINNGLGIVGALRTNSKLNKEDIRAARGSQFKTMEEIASNMEKAGLSVSNQGIDAKSMASLVRRGDIFGNGQNYYNLQEATGFIEILKDFDQQKNQFLDAYGEKAARFAEAKQKIFIEENKKAVKPLKGKELSDKMIEVYENASYNFMRGQIKNVALQAGINNDSFVNLLTRGLPSPLRGGTIPGPADSGKPKSINVPEHNITRIDFELNKALTDNARNYRAFGGAHVNLAEGALSAYKSSYSDILNTTTKAAGPKEVKAMLQIEREIDKVREKRNKEEEKGEAGRAKALELNEQIYILQGKQGIIEEKLNEERAKARDILDAQIDRLQQIVDLQQVLRDPLKNMITSAPAAYETSLLSQRKYDQADSVNFENQRQRAKVLYERDLAQINAQGGSDVAKRNAGVDYRNSLMHINQADEAAKKQVKDTADQNNIITNAALGIGNNILNKMGSNLIDNLMNKMAESIGGGEIFGMKLFGEDNPQVNALNGNTSSIDANTQAILGLTNSMAMGAVGGGLPAAGNFDANTGPGVGGLAAAGAGIAAMGVGGALTGGGLQGSSMMGSYMSRISNEAIVAASMRPHLTAEEKRQAWLHSPDDGGGDMIGQGANTGKSNNGFTMGGVTGGLMAGFGSGAGITKMRGKEGMAGMALGGIGGMLGSYFGPMGSMAGGLIGGLLGSFLDQDKRFVADPLEELKEIEEQTNLEMQKLEKRLNTLNETMENLINAPSNFALPIPKGILENSITAQSAIATPLQAGGLILRSGPAFLHAGEQVTRRNDVASGGGMSVSNSITIQGANKDPQEIANEVMNKINSTMQTQMQRTGNYRGRF